MTTGSPHEVVLASAGTGKTFELTSRLIRLLCGGCDPATILASTFTRKAAGEILDRVLERLASAAMDEGALRQLQEHVDPALDRARCAALVARLARDIADVQVMTLDAIFSRLAGAFPLELGVRPGWRIVSDHEDRALRRMALIRLLEQEPRNDLARFVAMIHANAASRRVFEVLEELVGKSHVAYLRAGRREEPWRRIGPRTRPLDEQHLAAAIDNLRLAPLPEDKKGDERKRFRTAHDRAILAAGSGDWEALLTKGIARCVAIGQETYSRVEIPASLASAYRPIVDHALAILLARLLDRNKAALAMTARFDREYRRLKARHGLLSFDDLPRLLAGGHDTLIRFYERLDARVDHLLLDEFQDTSLDQFRALEPMIDELLSCGDGSRSVFVVGDVKQSLYMWRDAEPTLLPSLFRRYEQLNARTLSRSYRSSPVVLDAVDRVFGSLPANPIAGTEQALLGWADGFVPHEAAHEDRPGVAVLRVAETDATNVAERRWAAIETAVQRTVRIRGEAPGASIGILTRTNSMVADLIDDLRRRGIPASEEGGNALTDSPSVSAALSLIRLADHPGDSAAGFHVSTGPIGAVVGLDGKSEAAAASVSRRVRRRLMDEGCAAMLEWIFERCASGMNAGESARFEQLIDLARGFDREPGSRPGDFVDLVEQVRVEAPGAEPVRVMTIHRSKGLEFDAVILPNLERGWNCGIADVIVDQGEGGADDEGPTVTLSPSALLREVDPEVAAIWTRARARHLYEQMCALYVAMTRAAHILEMIVHPRPGKAGGTCPLSAAGVLCGALAPDEAMEPGRVLWTAPSSDEAATFRYLRAQTTDQAPPPESVRVRLAPSAREPARRLARTSPSGLAATDHPRLFQMGSNEAAMTAGTLIHACLSRVPWIPEPRMDEEALLAIADGLGIDRARARSIIERFGAFLDSDLARRLLARDQYDHREPRAQRIEVRCEWPFAALDRESNAVLSGAFDRLVIGWSGDRAVWADVIDYKTDSIAGEDDLTRRGEHYRPQIRAYQRAAGELFGLDPASVTARLVFTEAGAVVDSDA